MLKEVLQQKEMIPGEIHNLCKGRKAPKMVNMWINKKDFYHFKFLSTNITCSKQKKKKKYHEFRIL